MCVCMCGQDLAEAAAAATALAPRRRTSAAAPPWLPLPAQPCRMPPAPAPGVAVKEQGGVRGAVDTGLTTTAVFAGLPSACRPAPSIARLRSAAARSAAAGQPASEGRQPSGRPAWAGRQRSCAPTLTKECSLSTLLIFQMRVCSARSLMLHGTPHTIQDKRCIITVNAL